jgi:hypothetical protein
MLSWTECVRAGEISPIPENGDDLPLPAHMVSPTASHCAAVTVNVRCPRTAEPRVPSGILLAGTPNY